MEVMKMGYIVSRAGIEPTSLAFLASVLAITPPHPTHLFIQLLAREVSTDYYFHPPGIVSLF